MAPLANLYTCWAMLTVLLAVDVGSWPSTRPQRVIAKIKSKPSETPGFVYAEGERLMPDGQLFRMVGYCYLPRDYGWTALPDWDW